MLHDARWRPSPADETQRWEGSTDVLRSPKILTRSLSVPAFPIFPVGQVTKGNSLATKCTRFEFRAWETSFYLLNTVMCLIVLLLVRSSVMKFLVVETENWNSKWLIPDSFPHGWSIPFHDPEKKSTYRVVFSKLSIRTGYSFSDIWHIIIMWNWGNSCVVWNSYVNIRAAVYKRLYKLRFFIIWLKDCLFL